MQDLMTTIRGQDDNSGAERTAASHPDLDQDAANNQDQYVTFEVASEMEKDTNNCNNCNDFEQPSELSIPDVDNGWAWCVLSASFLLRVILGGFFWSTNFYFVVFHDAFGESRAETSLIGALSFTAFHSMSPMSSVAIEKLGCRITIILGSLMITLNCLLNVCASGVLYLIVTNFFLFGLGCSFISNASLVSLQQYFRRYVNLATGISTSGAGVGTFLFSLLIPFLLETYGWRGSFFLLAGIGLQFCIAGAVLFPNNSVMPPKVILKTKTQPECCRNTKLLLKSKLFWFVSFSNFFISLHIFSFTILFKDLAILQGLESSFPKAQAAIGIGDIVGRIISGYTASRQFVNIVVLFFWSNVYGATIVLSLIAVEDVISQMACSLLLGIATGSQVLLLCIIPAIVFGRENYTLVLGNTQILSGIGALIGPLFSGFINDLTGSCTWTLLFLSGSNAAAAGFAGAIFCVETRRRKKQVAETTLDLCT